ncbi:hypothetical protein FB567DRAFT_543774 [Paraphoma chrysanthemicola]|uniref:Fungal calcium binding protein domain-containing protein n=1 Tax=Paraphoma chrysanthemicola TaxID=798071 RepID=A0A8K0W5Q4_9PLEO|nr:hypothetical protein FB567DRAFT_543774 [Paraphoma chrysanthemicola]
MRLSLGTIGLVALSSMASASPSDIAVGLSHRNLAERQMQYSCIAATTIEEEARCLEDLIELRRRESNGCCLTTGVATTVACTLAATTQPYDPILILLCVNEIGAFTGACSGCGPFSN